MDDALLRAFEAQRPRLLALAARMLGDRAEADDVAQQAWLRLHGTAARVEDLPAWLTTVTSRLCLDRLRARTPVAAGPAPDGAAGAPTAPTAPDPADGVVVADEVGAALGVVLDRLTPRERVALVLHDAFGVEHTTTAAVLGTSPASARQLASRARAKVGAAERPAAAAAPPGAREVVEAFLSAARGGDLPRLLQLLAPDVEVSADAEAALAGAPQQLQGRERVAAFFDGAARAALPVLHAGRPAAAWVHRGEVRVVFDITVADGLVQQVVFRAAPSALARVERRVTPGAARTSGGCGPATRAADDPTEEHRA